MPHGLSFMMFREYKQIYLLVFLVFYMYWSGVKATNQTNTTTAATFQFGQTTALYTNAQIQQSTTVSLEYSVGEGNSLTSGVSTTARMAEIEEDTLESWIIIIISLSAAIFLISVVILILLFIFRRQRIQRLERERHVSYNNANYESTVKFRQEDGDAGTLESRAATPRGSNNNPRRDAGYELVDLPGDSNPPNRSYENVTPQNLQQPKANAEPRHRYENVTPMVSPANDKAIDPIGRYEEVFLDTPQKREGDGKRGNDVYYENVEIKSN